jgi:hypothetical protein
MLAVVHIVLSLLWVLAIVAAHIATFIQERKWHTEIAWFNVVYGARIYWHWARLLFWF